MINQPTELPVSKAPANELVEDARSAVKRDPCSVLKEISKAPLHDSDNKVFNALKKAGYAFDAPITSIALSDDFQYPCIRPMDMIRKTIEAGFIDKVLGVPPSRAEQTFSQFWDKYRKIHGDHDLFDPGWGNVDFNHLVPYYLHGDGGRTYKGDQGHFGTPDKSHFGTHREAPVKRHFGTHRRQFGTPTDLWNTRGLGRELRGGWDDNVHLPCTTQVNHQHCYAFLHIPPIRPHTQRRHPHRLLSHAFPPAS